MQGARQKCNVIFFSQLAEWVLVFPELYKYTKLLYGIKMLDNIVKHCILNKFVKNAVYINQVVFELWQIWQLLVLENML